MRSDQEDNSVFNQIFKSGRFSHSRKILNADFLVTQKGAIVNFLDPNGVDRNATLPELEDGRFYVVANIGAAFNVVVKNATGGTVTTLLPGDTALMFASDNEWVALRGWAALGVFTNSVNGLVPAPNSAVPGSLFLRDDGQWAQVQVTGIVDAFKFMTDGTNTAIGAGPDTFRFRSSSGKISAVVTNNEAVFGDNVNLSVVEAFVDHDQLLNFFSDEHVGHSTVTLTAGIGLSGGGDITVSRTFNLDLNDLTTDTPVLADTLAFYDVSGADTNKTTFTVLNGILDHNVLVNYVSDQHVAHSGVSIVAGSGLTGGGTIAASRTLSLDINGLAADTLATGDFFPFFDISGGDNNKVTLANLNASLDHNSLLNYVANRHIDHTAVTLTAGAGLTGGGDISASRTFDVGAGTGITVNTNDVALDTTHVRNVDHSAVSIATAAGTSGLSGGGTIAATRNLVVDINGLTADAAPDGANDFLMTYDASAPGLKKVLLNNLPSSGFNIGGLTSATPVAADELPFNDISVPGNRKMTISALGDNFFVRWDAAQGGLSDANRLRARKNIASGPPDVIIQDQKSTTTHGGSSASGLNKRVLNTKVRDVLGIGALASDEFNLPAGTYYAEFSAPSFRSTQNRLFLRNMTDGAMVVIGCSNYGGISTVDGAMSIAHGCGTFTIVATKSFSLQHYILSSAATIGLGIATADGATEIYSEVRIWDITPT